mmetsp:Transcript_13361/g.24710  ORF Transcript_13361/g.24710 Transcript_13361/m.24710 type:complete len:80 (+) Transcript_13361:925-1164(+)
MANKSSNLLMDQGSEHHGNESGGRACNAFKKATEEIERLCRCKHSVESKQRTTAPGIVRKISVDDRFEGLQCHRQGASQ